MLDIKTAQDSTFLIVLSLKETEETECLGQTRVWSQNGLQIKFQTNLHYRFDCYLRNKVEWTYYLNQSHQGKCNLCHREVVV